ncbi:NUDIX domain-containing protein [Paenibacillus sp. GD4]|uniref:NUDIX domain-containing protein n=1 Tax=Paenibacillus sp. GD4 TaxID=3068890 RepID=UPI00279645DB|nr:NUDIX domain-containing protein [Paenibacillus sp. GD4]MDQ1914318.1 NUDIX domain-containing protein [Paenibacillus sp. GD4]
MTKSGIVLVASVSVLCVNKVLLIKENKPPVRDKWNFPGGRIEQDEDILDAARREVKEETGYDVDIRGANVFKQIIENIMNGKIHSLSLYNPKLGL